MSVSATLKSRSHGTPAGGNTVLDKAAATQLIDAAAAAGNKNITEQAKHPNSDKSVAPFVGLAVLQRGGDFVRYEYQPRPLADDDIEIDVQFCGICGSDLHTIDSGWGLAKYPVITGHEIVGRVSRVGSKVTRVAVGTVVGVGAEVLSCQHCHDCKNGDDAYCNQKIFTYNSVYADGQYSMGGYQNKVRVHNEWAFPIPAGLDPAEAAPLLCAGVTVFAPLIRHATAGMKIGVVGIGGLGHLAIQYASRYLSVLNDTAKHALASKGSVVAISTSESKKADALKLGATDFLVSTDAAAMKANIWSFDIIIMTANPDSLNLDPFIALLRTGGRLIPVAAPETPFTFGGVNWKRVNITGSLVGSKWECAAALEFAAKHGVRTMIEKFPVANASEAVKKMRENKLKYRAVLELPLP